MNSLAIKMLIQVMGDLGASLGAATEKSLQSPSLSPHLYSGDKHVTQLPGMLRGFIRCLESAVTAGC